MVGLDTENRAAAAGTSAFDLFPPETGSDAEQRMAQVDPMETFACGPTNVSVGWLAALRIALQTLI